MMFYKRKMSAKISKIYLSAWIVSHCFHCQVSNQLSLDEPPPLNAVLASKQLYGFSADNLESLDKHRILNCFQSCLAKKSNIPNN